jgi:pentapeptide MXKDX repeat protein
MLGRNETQIGHEPAGIREAGDVAEFRHQRRRGYQRQATQRCSAFTTGVSAQSGSAASLWASKQPRSSAHDCFEHNLSHSHSCDQFLFQVRNKRRLRPKSWRVTSVAKPENAFAGDFHAMIKHTALILSAATLSFGLALAPAAFADDTMKKDTMSKDSMSKDSMKKDSMSKDSMSEDTMSKDSMSKDSMSKDDMKKN